MDRKEFFKKKMVIGMVHLLPMPSNASYRGDNDEIVRCAIKDAKTLLECGVDAIMLENFNDWPQYSTEIPLESYSLMLNIASQIRQFCDKPFGINIEMNAYLQEYMMAYAVKADFIRVEAFVDNRAGSFGMIEACSTQLMDLKRKFPSDAMWFTDVHTGETYGFPDVPINELAQNAINHESSAIIVTENDECKRVTVEDVKSMKEKIKDFPVIVGSGVKTNNVLDYLEYADGVIVGRGFKTGDSVDPKLVNEFMEVVRSKY